MKRSTYYRQASRWSLGWFALCLGVAIYCGCRFQVAYRLENATEFTAFFLTGLVSAYLARGHFRFYRQYRDRANMAEATEWRYHNTQARALRGFVSRNHKKQ